MASLVQSLVWPAAVIVIVVFLRKPIRAALSHALLRRVKAGPVELEFDQLQAEVREELARSPELAKAPVPASVPSLREELSRLAEISPPSAVMEAFKRIEYRLVEMVEMSDSPGTPPRRTQGSLGLARMARERDLISDETLAAIQGMSVLRNLAAHSGADISVDRARDYLALADAVLYALRPKPSN